ncbi:hypothetical protein IIC68_01675 [archaeon]|nr:hypothetical protein [archaeon]
MRIRGIVDFFGNRIHSIVRKKPPHVERTHETTRTNPIPDQPKRNVPFIFGQKKRSTKEPVRKPAPLAEGTGKKLDVTAKDGEAPREPKKRFDKKV